MLPVAWKLKLVFPMSLLGSFGVLPWNVTADLVCFVHPVFFGVILSGDSHLCIRMADADLHTSIRSSSEQSVHLSP